MISHKHKFIFIPVRKTACRAIISALLPFSSSKTKFKFNCGTSPPYGDTARNDWEHEIHKYNNYRVVTTVRNPWDRIISGYFFFQRGKRWLGRSVGLKEYLQTLPTKKANWNMWFHTQCTMQAMLTDASGAYVVDYTMRFERLEQDFTGACKLLGIRRPTIPNKAAAHNPRTKEGARRRRYTYYYTDDTRRMVAKMFADDIRTFGYDFEGNIPKRTTLPAKGSRDLKRRGGKKGSKT